MRNNNSSFYSPFRIRIDPMQRLLLINITKDPDQVYIGFEPQVFDDSIHGKGMIVLGYRNDGKVDVIHQPGLTLDPDSYAVVGKGLANMFERPMQGARFEVTPNGLHIAFAFTDRLGRLIEVEIRETKNRPRRTFELLAPLGTSTENPPGLPLFWLYDFGFVRRAGTQVRIEIAGRQHRLDKMPVPVAGEWVYYTRYTTDPLIMSWNPTFEGVLRPVPASEGQVQHEGVLYSLVDNQGHLEIERMRVEHANYPDRRHVIDYTFSPPLPDITSLKEDERREGTFLIQGEESIGQVNGEYAAWREGETIFMKVHPSGGWQPAEKRWSVKIIFRVASIFRTWPKTYEWTAEIRRGEDGELRQKSGWSRVG